MVGVKNLKLSWLSVMALIILILGVIVGLFAGGETYGPLHPFEISRNLPDDFCATPFGKI